MHERRLKRFISVNHTVVQHIYRFEGNNQAWRRNIHNRMLWYWYSFNPLLSLRRLFFSNDVFISVMIVCSLFRNSRGNSMWRLRIFMRPLSSVALYFCIATMGDTFLDWLQYWSSISWIISISLYFTIWYFSKKISNSLKADILSKIVSISWYLSCGVGLSFVPSLTYDGGYSNIGLSWVLVNLTLITGFSLGSNSIFLFFL